MSNQIRSTDILDDRTTPVQPRPRLRERVGFGDVLTEHERKILEYEERLRDLKAQLEELEKRAAQNQRPGFAASVRFVSPAELAQFPTYSR